MVTATVTSKGQITIPKAIRDSLRLRSGDRVVFEVRDHDGATMTPVNKSVDAVYGRLHRPGQAPRSLEDMKQAVAKRIRGRKS